MKTVEEMRAYLQQALESFISDPADTRFQEGYKAAIEEFLKVLNTGD